MGFPLLSVNFILMISSRTFLQIFSPLFFLIRVCTLLYNVFHVLPGPVNFLSMVSVDSRDFPRTFSSICLESRAISQVVPKRLSTIIYFQVKLTNGPDPIKRFFRVKWSLCTGVDFVTNEDIS